MGIYAKATTLQIMQQTISYEKGLTISTTLSVTFGCLTYTIIVALMIALNNKTNKRDCG